jgi:hypothetical protein
MDLQAFWGSAEGESSKRNGQVNDPPILAGFDPERLMLRHTP